MPNLGHDVTYSGTVTAAMEAIIWGVPGIAFSLGSVENSLTITDFTTAGRVAKAVVDAAIHQPAPTGTLLNVNIPMLPGEDLMGYRTTRLGLRVYRDRLEKRVDPRGGDYYWIGGEAPTGISEYGTDIGAMCDGYVSITPIQLDLTAYNAFPTVEKWSLDNLPNVNQPITHRLYSIVGLLNPPSYA
jgi:5'-nucleotidase